MAPLRACFKEALGDFTQTRKKINNIIFNLHRMAPLRTCFKEALRGRFHPDAKGKDIR